jgi:DNA-directed RNA polymerase specialized sigma24 family protein
VAEVVRSCGGGVADLVVPMVSSSVESTRMTASTPPDGFASFVAREEPRLRRALIARYGAVDGRAATVDAMSWAWEHWDRLQSVGNKVGYLYRVGQSSARRYAWRPAPVGFVAMLEESFPEVDPGLLPALAGLSEHQRVVVLLVHGFGWSQAEVAELLDIGPSTVQAHLKRAVDRLRAELGERDVR